MWNIESWFHPLSLHPFSLIYSILLFCTIHFLIFIYGFIFILLYFKRSSYFENRFITFYLPYTTSCNIGERLFNEIYLFCNANTFDNLFFFFLFVFKLLLYFRRFSSTFAWNYFTGSIIETKGSAGNPGKVNEWTMHV